MNKTNNIIPEKISTQKSYSQDKKFFNHNLRTMGKITTPTPYIPPPSPSYPSYYKSSLKKSDNEKIAFLTECLKEKEEELALLNKCLEEKENELKKYLEKNIQKQGINRINNNKNLSNINNTNNDENKLHEQIELYENEIERRNKEIILLKKRIRNLLLYLKRKDNNILILDNELRMYEKENEEIKIDNKNLTKENKKLEKINENLLAKKECICNIGLEHCNNAVIEQKKEKEILRNRFDDLFNELDEYRKRNGELSKELKQLKEDSKKFYKENENYDMINSIADLKDRLSKLKKENVYLKGLLNKNKIYVKYN